MNNVTVYDRAKPIWEKAKENSSGKTKFFVVLLRGQRAEPKCFEHTTKKAAACRAFVLADLHNTKWEWVGEDYIVVDASGWYDDPRFLTVIEDK